VLEGERAHSALDELNEYFKKRESLMLAALKREQTPETAFVLACQYKAMHDFVSAMRAEVAIGREAARDLIEEE
jgi:hypothetical protein